MKVNKGTIAFASSQAEARALDAADGVIDGKHYGAGHPYIA